MYRPSATRVTSMLQVNGATYRLVRRLSGVYDVIRILDDLSVGEFRIGPPLEVVPKAIDHLELQTIALAAIQHAKTSWHEWQALVTHLRPTM